MDIYSRLARERRGRILGISIPSGILNRNQTPTSNRRPQQAPKKDHAAEFLEIIKRPSFRDDRLDKAFKTSAGAVLPSKQFLPDKQILNNKASLPNIQILPKKSILPGSKEDANTARIRSMRKRDETEDPDEDTSEYAEFSGPLLKLARQIKPTQEFVKAVRDDFGESPPADVEAGGHDRMIQWIDEMGDRVKPTTRKDKIFLTNFQNMIRGGMNEAKEKETKHPSKDPAKEPAKDIKSSDEDVAKAVQGAIEENQKELKGEGLADIPPAANKHFESTVKADGAVPYKISHEQWQKFKTNADKAQSLSSFRNNMLEIKKALGTSTRVKMRMNPVSTPPKYDGKKLKGDALKHHYKMLTHHVLRLIKEGSPNSCEPGYAPPEPEAEEEEDAEAEEEDAEEDEEDEEEPPKPASKPASKPVEKPVEKPVAAAEADPALIKKKSRKGRK